MSWERDPLWAKARHFCQIGASMSHDDPLFGIWHAFGLELLIRCSLSSLSPTLLADPESSRGADKNQVYSAITEDTDNKHSRTISIVKAIRLCAHVYTPNLTTDHVNFCESIIDCRNREVHTGAAAFVAYRRQNWLPQFYDVCRVLTEAMGESLETLFEEDEASIARESIATGEKELIHRVNETVAKRRKAFEGLSEEDRRVLREAAEAASETLSRLHCHKAVCPSCQSAAIVRGRVYGFQKVSDEDGEIIIRQPVALDSFQCNACGLRLSGCAELLVAGLGEHYTRKMHRTPADFYDLIDPDDFDPSPYIEDYLANMQDYDNE